MSRIGKKTITIPEGVEIKINDDFIIVKGPKGELKQELPFQIGVVRQKKSNEDLEKGEEIAVKIKNKTKDSQALRGLFRSLIFNMIQGVTEGFEKKLEIEGVGYRASLQGNNLVLNLGLSHPVEIKAPEGIKFEVEKNIITVFGIDKQLVGQISAKIRDKKKPEPYKGKGIHYLGEVIRRKAGKKAAGGE